MHTHPSPRRDFEGMEHRPETSSPLVRCWPADSGAIARELRVSRQSVSRWLSRLAAWRSSRPARCGPSGSQAQADPKQLRQIERNYGGVLGAGVRHGFVDASPGRKSDRAFDRSAPITLVMCGGFGAMDWSLQRPAPASPRAQSGESEALADREMVGSKKNARRRKA